jgi:hypothetical protein
MANYKDSTSTDINQDIGKDRTKKNGGKKEKLESERNEHILIPRLNSWR